MNRRVQIPPGCLKESAALATAISGRHPRSPGLRFPHFQVMMDIFHSSPSIHRPGCHGEREAAQGHNIDRLADKYRAIMAVSKNKGIFDDGGG